MLGDELAQVCDEEGRAGRLLMLVLHLLLLVRVQRALRGVRLGAARRAGRPPWGGERWGRQEVLHAVAGRGMVGVVSRGRRVSRGGAQRQARGLVTEHAPGLGLLRADSVHLLRASKRQLLAGIERRGAPTASSRLGIETLWTF